MKTCLIYGQNGLDLDVAFNLQAFYKKLGFWSVFSENLIDADLLVILRAIDKPLDYIGFNYRQIHVFDYGGWTYDKCIKSLDYQKTYLFTTSANRKEHVIKVLNFPVSQVFVAVPPVETSLWIEKPLDRKYNFVHIGNFKNIDEFDIIRKKFNVAIEDLDSDVWGLNWILKKEKKYHGKAGLFEVSKIYAQSQYALGLMYPFQRDITFSGRFWHAPLNGCYVFSEAGLYSKKIPGIIETCFCTQEIMESAKKNMSHSSLKNEAKNFWEAENRMLQKTINNLLLHENFGNIRIKSKMVFIFYTSVVFLRKVYQKYRLFDLLAKMRNSY